MASPINWKESDKIKFGWIWGSKKSLGVLTDLTSLTGILMGEIKRTQVVQSLYTNQNAGSVKQNFCPVSYDKIAPAENSSAEN